ncbi:dTDP-4-dehydrorhamnose 3,5-epimerase [Paenibacillus sambharensis]|uniref:dTDP-4-dehydrorhamnose 3,5-epimerase n=1 Tax=Paenibacillus sambharensis TaxID=1803190 RepID=UPI0024823593|nr:dTDP-4-dehydrorhamnose 3,5-epimerase [Paenibacillus sambharensis]
MFRETALKGAFVIEPEKIKDERGFFSRSWCRQEFEKHGLESDFVQCNISQNRSKATLRGMHYQQEPYGETKLIRCTRGAIYDVIVDLRPSSETYKGWAAYTLSQENYMMLYVPEGFAHGFVTLENDTEVFYQMGNFYKPEAARGIRWDDPAIGIRWPDLGTYIISERDLSYGEYQS